MAELELFTAEEILEAGRAVRPYLNELRGDEAAAVDRELAELLVAAAGGTEVDHRVRQILDATPQSRAWALGFLTRNRPAVFRGGSFSPAPGLPIPPPRAPRYVCPHGDYTWHQISVSQSVPPCPTHKVPLQRI